MSKKVKVLISIVAAALLLTMGGVTMVMAEAEEETTPTAQASRQGLLERVADILEIDREALIDAFKQAQQEIRGEAFINRLNQAVAGGRITQEQADEIMEWWRLRPDDEIMEWWGMKPQAIKPGMVEGAMHSGSAPGFHMRNRHGWGFHQGLPGEAD